MRRDAREWSIPEPLRALLWWPAVSFVIAIAKPDAAVPAIIAAGFVLALTGALAHALGKRMRRADVSPLPQAADPAELDAAA